jgi:dienelactone hydrolase
VPVRRLAVLCALLACALPAAAILQEQVIELPVTLEMATGKRVSQPIKVTIFRDDASAKSPFLILNHGRPAKRDDFAKLGRVRYSENAKYFVGKGFAVFVPTRIGYGVTGGEDVEYSGACRSRNYPPAYEAAAQQTLAVLEHARTLAYVDASRGLVVGQSFGGATAIAVAAKNVPGVVAAVSFAGGGGGNPTDRPGDPCRPDLLGELFAGYGKTARIPTLWLYSENDRYFGKEHPQDWFRAFVAAGGKGEFVQLPAHGADGHSSFTRNPRAWRPAFDAFLRRSGF